MHSLHVQSMCRLNNFDPDQQLADLHSYIQIHTSILSAQTTRSCMRAGSVPSLAPAKLLTDIDLSANRLSGPLPALPADVEAVDMSHNDFTGAIPASYGALPPQTDTTVLEAEQQLGAEGHRPTSPPRACTSAAHAGCGTPVSGDLCQPPV